jgi:hypothetical protein
VALMPTTSDDRFFYKIQIKYPLIATISKDENNNTFLKQGTFTGKLAF